MATDCKLSGVMQVLHWIENIRSLDNMSWSQNCLAQEQAAMVQVQVQAQSVYIFVFSCLGQCYYIPLLTYGETLSKSPKAGYYYFCSLSPCGLCFHASIVQNSSVLYPLGVLHN